jgi:hypothetical protein
MQMRQMQGEAARAAAIAAAGVEAQDQAVKLHGQHHAQA